MEPKYPTDMNCSEPVQIKLFVSEIRLPNMEQILTKIPGVTSCSYNEKDKTLIVQFSGNYSLLPRLEQQVSNMGVSAHLISPLHLVIRTSVSSKIEWQAKLKATGAKCVYEEAGQWHVYTDLASVDFDKYDTIARALNGKCQVVSHEWIALKLDRDPSPIKKDLIDLKYVLRVDVSGTTVKLLVVKGQVSTTAIKSVLEKKGYLVEKEAR